MVDGPLFKVALVAGTEFSLHYYQNTHTQSGFYGASSTAPDESRAPKRRRRDNWKESQALV